jgi:hypothetical protein
MAHLQVRGNLSHRQMLHFIEVLHLVDPGLIHRRSIRESPFSCHSRLLSSLSVSMGRKGPFPNPLQAYLVFYHSKPAVRDKENQLLERFFMGHPVFYHLSFPPGLQVRLIETGKVAGVSLNPCSLGGPFPLLLALGVETCLLSLFHPAIRNKVSSTEQASFDHLHTPLPFSIV